MSIATTGPRDSKFLARFEHVCASLRRFQLRQGLCVTLLAALLGMALLAAVDLRMELTWNARVVALLAWATVTLLVLWFQVVAPLRWWTKPRTAIEIERRFPQLGQRIRTVVQYAGLSEESIHSHGAAPSLVEALERETDVRVGPLPIDRIVPWPRVWAIGALAVIPLLLLLFASVWNAEWRIALARALLSRQPYTTLSVAPENVVVDRGDSVQITVELHGRLRRDVVLYTRAGAQPGAPWKPAPLETVGRGPSSKRQARLEKVEQPLDYRVAAGPALSPTYRIDVRYPLAVHSFEVALEPPAYTGVKASIAKGGDLRVIDGTHATFRIGFDSPPAGASLVLTDSAVPSTKGKAPKAPLVLPLELEGAIYRAELTLTKGQEYHVEARTADGRATPIKRYKIEVLEDRAPRVAFEQPSEALEVHPVAEIVNRIRAGDDFGLTRAGIVFQFNNGDEQTLIVKDFKAEPVGSRTSAALQETLLLEKLAASPTDSLTYYAFAEDNHPAGSRRTETDLRYIDIRPFKREYKLAEAGSGMEGEPDELATLDELIARQRFNLNRSTRLAKHKPTDKAFAEDPLKIASFEETLVTLTRELTQGFEGIVGQRIEPLHAAEESMLAAVAALDHGQNGRAPAHMGDALRHLVSARNSLRVLIGQDTATRRAMMGYDRMQAQKIRKPKKDPEAEEIAEEIEQLARDEDFVYATLNGLKIEQEADEARKGGQEIAADLDASGDAKKNKRSEATKRQEQIVERLRELEEKLKKLESASDLAKVRMANAAETAAKASGALSRGKTSEAIGPAKSAAAKLHELARQIKGELAEEVAAELAMARDLADELAEREAELGRMPANAPSPGASPGEGGSGKPGQGDLTEAEQLERLEEAGKTLENWLKDASLSAQGDSAERIRQLIEESEATRVVESMRRIGELYVGGQKPEARRDAKELSRTLELLARQLDALYRAIIAPELAKLVDLERRVADLMQKLEAAPPGGETAEWQRLADALAGDLEKAGLTEIAKTFTDSVDNVQQNGPGTRLAALRSIGTLLQGKIQNLILKDMMSASDEATPPAFKELVERYYEVISRTGVSQ